MRNRGISIPGIIVLLGLGAFIVWGLNYILTKDFVVVRAPITTAQNTIANPVAQANTAATSSTLTTTSAATSTPAKTPVPIATTTPAASTLKPSVSPNSSDLTVTFTDKGFSPTSLTVLKNQTVTFVNNGSEKLWVAANPFPSSSDYPAFNEKSGVASGSSWSFTFDKAGVWFYHNHYHPALGAKIIVNAK